MGWFSESGDHEESYKQFNEPHKASLSHELLSGAVAFEATKAYEDHCEANGQPVEHALAKKLMAGFAGAALDRLVETKGLDAWDDHKRKAVLAKSQERMGFSESDTVTYSGDRY